MPTLVQLQHYVSFSLFKVMDFISGHIILLESMVFFPWKQAGMARTVPISKHSNRFLQPFTQVTVSSHFYCVLCQHFILNRCSTNFQIICENQVMNSHLLNKTATVAYKQRGTPFNKLLSTIPPQLLDQGSCHIDKGKRALNLEAVDKTLSWEQFPVAFTNEEMPFGLRTSYYSVTTEHRGFPSAYSF